MGLTIIYAIIIFCLLIFVHEFGHFSVAKAVGIRVNEFSLGMGPLIFQFEKGETEYSLRALPIGGYVKMEGEDEESDDPRSFNNKPAWQKALVVVAGSTMNILTTIVIIATIALTVGLATNTIAEVSPGYPSEAAGLMPGDRIIQINETKTNSWDDVTTSISGTTEDSVYITVEREGKQLSLMSGVITDENGRRIIGVTSKLEHSFSKSIKTGVYGTWFWTKEMVNYLGLLFTGGGSMDDLVGPVGIVSIINDQAKLGVVYIANLAALISLNLGIINLLPLPALDGGRLLFLIIRQFTGKAISDEIEAKIHFAGILLLFGLMIYLVVQDVDRFIFK